MANTRQNGQTRFCCGYAQRLFIEIGQISARATASNDDNSIKIILASFNGAQLSSNFRTRLRTLHCCWKKLAAKLVAVGIVVQLC